MPSADMKYMKLLEELIDLRLMLPAKYTKEYLNGEEWRRRNERIKEINAELDKLEPQVKGYRVGRGRLYC